ncbi:hypothetical protein CONLIGDRAFT_677351 [Coniochaeta ligniaria NRRL 30616]|uniref:Uncharacterized protein n=1 Tax=Coniochaeta ligniaria NRRL 30616 TaxID=1408157 RepID=A0A1J7K0D5_9PEZI|nr:hypothetical protein CONLIGDRAFT_677351 [Coniochaeta ligniaria NRRL 30616]
MSARVTAVADVVFQVGGPGGTFALAQVDQGDQVITSQLNNPLFKNAINAFVVNAGEVLDGRPQACGCVAFLSPTCTGNPRFAFGGNVTDVPGDLLGDIGCYVCV